MVQRPWSTAQILQGCRLTGIGGAAIEVEDLTKRYEAGGVQALSGVSFAVREGEIFAYLGRNGAGKSTTVRILTTLTAATSGRAEVLGLDVATQPAAVRRHLGVVLQESALDELMSGREHLVLAARLVGLPPKAASSRADELLEMFGLTTAAHRITARYSGGMRRRLSIALALVRHPPVLFLDEPTTGLDPQSRRGLWELIRGLRAQGSTVFLTTQYLAEADELAERVAIIHSGTISAIGTPEELKRRLGATTVRARPSDQAGADRLLTEPGAAPDPKNPAWIVIPVPDGPAGVPALVGRLTAGPGVCDRIDIVDPTLEEVFMTLTGTDIEAPSDSGEAGGVAAIRRMQGVSSASGSRL